MLPKFMKFIAVNNTGVTNTWADGGRLELKITGWFITPSTGKIDYTALSVDDFGFGTGDTTVDGGEDMTSEIDNSTTLYLGYLVQLKVTHSLGATAAGTYDLYVDAGDATGELASDENGYYSAEANGLQYVGSLTWQDTDAANDDVMRSPVFNVG